MSQVTDKQQTLGTQNAYPQAIIYRCTKEKPTGIFIDGFLTPRLRKSAVHQHREYLHRKHVKRSSPVYIFVIRQSHTPTVHVYFLTFGGGLQRTQI